VKNNNLTAAGRTALADAAAANGKCRVLM